MKKINFGGKLELSGPLSRNERIRNLKTGEMISGKIVKRINKYQAVIEVLGNKLKGNFISEVPFSKYLNFEIIQSNKENIVFKIVKENRQNLVNMFLSLLDESEVNKNEIIYNLIKNSKESTFSVFNILLNHFKKKKSIQKKINLMDKINIQKASPIEKFILQTVFNKTSEKDIEFVYNLLFKYSNFEENISEDALLEYDLTKFLEHDIYDAPMYYKVKNENDDLKEMEFFQNDEFLLMCLNYGNLGQVEIVAFWSENKVLNIFYDNDKIKIKDLDSILKNKVSKNISVNYFKTNNFMKNLKELKIKSFNEYYG